MKISLIDAGLPANTKTWRGWSARDGRFAFPSVGLVSLASLVGENDAVEIIDEKVDGTADHVEADLAGISFKTMNAQRAYRLADTLRARGIRVVLGGLHASLCPQEAGAHADAVVVGEGEPVWRQLLDDAGKGRLKPVYVGPSTPAPIDKLPAQRMEILKQDRYLWHSVQTARGCSLNCEFCPTRAMFGPGFRLRNPEAVARDVECLLALEKKVVFFVDDVFGAGHMDFIRNLAGRMKSMAAEYGLICDLRMVNGELIDLLAGSGCRLMCFDIFGAGTSEEVQAVRAIQAAGIHVLAYFMFGFEPQRADVFQRSVDFVRQNDIRSVSMVLLAPYPGTPMFKRLEDAGRILSKDWNLYDQAHVVFKPANMTAQELEEGFAFMHREIGDLYDVEGVMAGAQKKRRA